MCHPGSSGARALCLALQTEQMQSGHAHLWNACVQDRQGLGQALARTRANTRTQHEGKTQMSHASSKLNKTQGNSGHTSRVQASAEVGNRP
eukprot:1148793-Pelagomonas_calceolata.AAC.4